MPEIFDGTVIVKSVAREAGDRSKISVHSDNPDIDAVGACVGAKGARVEAVVEELGGEKLILFNGMKILRYLLRMH